MAGSRWHPSGSAGHSHAWRRHPNMKNQSPHGQGPGSCPPSRQLLRPPSRVHQNPAGCWGYDAGGGYCVHKAAPSELRPVPFWTRPSLESNSTKEPELNSREELGTQKRKQTRARGKNITGCHRTGRATVRYQQEAWLAGGTGGRGAEQRAPACWVRGTVPSGQASPREPGRERRCKKARPTGAWKMQGQ